MQAPLGANCKTISLTSSRPSQQANSCSSPSKQTSLIPYPRFFFLWCSRRHAGFTLFIDPKSFDIGISAKLQILHNSRWRGMQAEVPVATEGGNGNVPNCSGFWA